jgi:predicted nucleotidyltransferase component of viral defense system
MPFNPLQRQRLEIMRAIAQNLIDENVILKGGTGLLLCYNLDRFSEDMDLTLIRINLV